MSKLYRNGPLAPGHWATGPLSPSGRATGCFLQNCHGQKHRNVAGGPRRGLSPGHWATGPLSPHHWATGFLAPNSRARGAWPPDKMSVLPPEGHLEPEISRKKKEGQVK